MIFKDFLLVCLLCCKCLKSVEKIVALKVRLFEEEQSEKYVYFIRYLLTYSLLFSAESVIPLLWDSAVCRKLGDSRG